MYKMSILRSIDIFDTSVTSANSNSKIVQTILLVFYALSGLPPPGCILKLPILSHSLYHKQFFIKTCQLAFLAMSGY